MAISVNSSVVVEESLFQNNVGGSKGGAVAVFSQGIPSFMNTNFTENRATTGGVMYLADGANVTISDCLMFNNSAGSLGGALYLLSDSHSVISTTIIQENSANSGPGGGIYMQDFAYANLVDSVISVRLKSVKVFTVTYFQ